MNLDSAYSLFEMVKETDRSGRVLVSTQIMYTCVWFDRMSPRSLYSRNSKQGLLWR